LENNEHGIGSRNASEESEDISCSWFKTGEPGNLSTVFKAGKLTPMITTVASKACLYVDSAGQYQKYTVTIY